MSKPKPQIRTAKAIERAMREGTFPTLHEEKRGDGPSEWWLSDNKGKTVRMPRAEAEQVSLSAIVEPDSNGLLPDCAQSWRIKKGHQAPSDRAVAVMTWRSAASKKLTAVELTLLTTAQGQAQELVDMIGIEIRGGESGHDSIRPVLNRLNLTLRRYLAR